MKRINERIAAGPATFDHNITTVRAKKIICQAEQGNKEKKTVTNAERQMDKYTKRDKCWQPIQCIPESLNHHVTIFFYYKS